MLSEAEFAEYVSSYDKLIENEKEKNLQKKIWKVGGTDTRQHEAQSNIQLTKHNRNAEIQNNLPSQATLGFHLPGCLEQAWIPGRQESQGKQLSSSFNQKLSSYHKWIQIFNTQIHRLLVPLELKAGECAKEHWLSSTGFLGHEGQATGFPTSVPNFKAQRQTSHVLGQSQKSGCDTVNVSHVHSYNFWECFGCQ